jgi:protoheme IX farnesyltransferase
MSGLPYLAGVTVLNIGFLWYALRMLRHRDDEQLPMQAFRYSVLYLMTLFALLLADHYFLLALPNGA